MTRNNNKSTINPFASQSRINSNNNNININITNNKDNNIDNNPNRSPRYINNQPKSNSNNIINSTTAPGIEALLQAIEEDSRKQKNELQRKTVINDINDLKKRRPVRQCNVGKIPLYKHNSISHNKRKIQDTNTRINPPHKKKQRLSNNQSESDGNDSDYKTNTVTRRRKRIPNNLPVCLIIF